MTTRSIGLLAIACVCYLVIVITLATYRDIVTNSNNVQSVQTGDQR